MESDVLLAEVTRGAVVESVHGGSIAVCDASGRLLASAGDPDKVAYWRSAAKPVQVLALVESGALEAWGLGAEHLAIACGSHAGERGHVAAVQRMLDAAGIPKEALRCGASPTETGDPPDERRHNCSGKHAGMLLASKRKGLPLKGYLDPSHPHQVRIRELIAAMTDLKAAGLVPATDGCSAPIYALPLRRMATAFARLLQPPAGLEAPCRRVVEAMTAHPFMVSGTRGFDTDLMARAGDRIVSKVGAEGVRCLAVRSLGLGVALKIADGNPRATGPAAIEALRQLGALDAADIEALKHHARPEIGNARGLVVGGIRATAFTLERTGR